MYIISLKIENETVKLRLNFPTKELDKNPDHILHVHYRIYSY